MHELAEKLSENPVSVLVCAVIGALIPLGCAVYFAMTDGNITVLTIIFIVLAVVILAFGIRAYMSLR